MILSKVRKLVTLVGNFGYRDKCELCVYGLIYEDFILPRCDVIIKVLDCLQTLPWFIIIKRFVIYLNEIPFFYFKSIFIRVYSLSNAVLRFY